MLPDISPKELVRLLPFMTAEEKLELDKLLTDGLPLWMPQVGPQHAAYYSEADIVFYGGAAGGGKTDLLLGLCLTAQEHSIIFRREAVQLIGIEERMTKIVGTRTGYNSQTGVWRLPGNRVMELGSVKLPDDWMKYQGRAHDIKCLGRGTPVLMADGSYKAIESVAVGEMVATLEGPRRVTRRMTMRKAATRATASVGGRVIASQVQGQTHELLTPSGWVSRDTTLVCGASSPTQHHCACRSAGSSSPTSGPSSSVLASQCHHEVLPQALRPDHEGCLSRSGSCAGVARSVQGTDCAGSVCRPSEGEQPVSAICHQEPTPPARRSAGQGCAEPSAPHGASCALSASSPQGSMAHCSSGLHPDGEQPRQAEAGGLQCLLQQVDAEPQSPSCFGADAQGRTPTHSLRIEWYVHPYTKETRQTRAEFALASLVFTDVGVQDLFDLTVDEVNHYITAGGFVNKNCFDEITHFLESQFRTLIGWMRTDNPNIRQRVVCAGNPPTDADGEWVVRFWAPWLDPKHPRPAKSGELRWYVTDEKGDDKEVPDGTPVMVGTDLVRPKSRTFISSSVDDNLYLSLTDYKSTLQALPEPLRSQMLRGDFMAGRTDPVWQLIPTEWVKAAMARWTEREAKGPMTCLGFDVARGGIDKSTAARRHKNWFDKMVTAPGIVTNDGPKAAAFITPLIRNGAPIAIDGIGIGTSALDFIKGLNLRVHAVIGSEGSKGKDETGNLRFRNVRAEMYWRLREALDPTNEEPLYLPDDKELLGDLCAVRYKVVQMGPDAGILIRDKDEIREVLGRSPDKGDAVAMTFAPGVPAVATHSRAEIYRQKRGLSARD
jgi:hypothetical protein